MSAAQQPAEYRVDCCAGQRSEATAAAGPGYCFAAGRGVARMSNKSTLSSLLRAGRRHQIVPKPASARARLQRAREGGRQRRAHQTPPSRCATAPICTAGSQAQLSTRHRVKCPTHRPIPLVTYPPQSSPTNPPTQHPRLRHRHLLPPAHLSVACASRLLIPSASSRSRFTVSSCATCAFGGAAVRPGSALRTLPASSLLTNPRATAAVHPLHGAAQDQLPTPLRKPLAICTVRSAAARRGPHAAPPRAPAPARAHLPLQLLHLAGLVLLHSGTRRGSVGAQAPCAPACMCARAAAALQAPAATQPRRPAPTPAPACLAALGEVDAQLEEVLLGLLHLGDDLLVGEPPELRRLAQLSLRRQDQRPQRRPPRRQGRSEGPLRDELPAAEEGGLHDAAAAGCPGCWPAAWAQEG